jgi:hypothetical protein
MGLRSSGLPLLLPEEGIWHPLSLSNSTPGLSSRAWQPATAPMGEFELAPPVPPLYDRPRNLKESWRQFQTPDRGFTSFWMSALRLADGRPTKHTKHTKRIRGREVVALFSRLTISRVSCVLLAKFHGPVRSVEFATVVLTRRMWLRPSGLDFGRSVSAALPRGWILAAPFPGDSTRGLSSRAWQPAIVS